MNTLEIVKKILTKYFIEYVIVEEDLSQNYFQLVRTEDCAILYANENLNNIFIHCWDCDIKKSDVSIW